MSILRGALIAIEGIDRVGKTTIAHQVVDSLCKSGMPAEYIRFPDRSTPVGRLISSYLTGGDHLDDHAIHLLFSANRWELNEKIKKTLLSGTSLVVDRYAYSGVAYSTAKQKADLSIDWCKSSDAGLVKADVVFYLTLDESLESREGYGQEKYESVTFQEQVKRAYDKLRSDSWITIKTDGLTSDEVHARVLEHAKSIIKSSCQKELSYLW